MRDFPLTDDVVRESVESSLVIFHDDDPTREEARAAFDRWLATRDAEVVASALEALARAERGMADWIGADIDGRGRTRLGEVAREYRSGKRICGSSRDG